MNHRAVMRVGVIRRNKECHSLGEPADEIHRLIIFDPPRATPGIENPRLPLPGRMKSDQPASAGIVGIARTLTSGRNP